MCDLLPIAIASSCVVALLVLLDSPAMSADVYPTIIGAGGNSCGTWTAEKHSRRRLEYEGWIVGYFSAVNRYSPDTDGHFTRSTDGRGLVAWIDTYCLAHPLDQIDTAAVALVRELH